MNCRGAEGRGSRGDIFLPCTTAPVLPCSWEDRVTLTRPSWDEYFIEITHAVAKRSTCHRAQVGAIIIKDKRILTTGYNGAPRGLPHCLDTGCEIVDGHCVRTLHAEQNAIIKPRSTASRSKAARFTRRISRATPA